MSARTNAIKTWQTDEGFRKLCEVAREGFAPSNNATLVYEYLEKAAGGDTFDADPHRTAYLCGRRSILLDIQTMIELAINPPKGW